MDTYEAKKKMYKACFDGDLEVLKNCKPDNLCFVYAVNKGHLHIFQYLEEECNMYPEKDIFLEAIRRDHVELVSRLGKTIAFDYDCLKCALENGCWIIVDMILKTGLSLFDSCISFIIYGKRIKEYVDYKASSEEPEETRVLVTEGQEPF